MNRDMIFDFQKLDPDQVDLQEAFENSVHLSFNRIATSGGEIGPLVIGSALNNSPQAVFFFNRTPSFYQMNSVIAKTESLSNGTGLKHLTQLTHFLWHEFGKLKLKVFSGYEDRVGTSLLQKSGLNGIRIIEDRIPKNGSNYFFRLPSPQLETHRLLLCLPTPDDSSELLQLHLNEKTFWDKWDPVKPSFFYTEEYWHQKSQVAIKEFQQDQSLRLLIKMKSNQRIIGTINFTNFERGPFQNCRVGYKLAEGAQGHGYMHEALQSALDYVFKQMEFHRVEANYIPQNNRSGAVLDKLGFSIAGRSSSYLKINGQWQDHTMTYLNNPTWDDLDH